MKTVDPETLPLFTDDHPTGALAQRYLFVGEDLTPDNFMLSIADNIGRFQMVRHRHNFDQFRFALSGDLNMGDGRVLREGWLAYFPEGAAYGPQDDAAGPVALVLQFGGASGYGYMSPEQYRAGRAALNQVGHFEGAVFVRPRPDGSVKKTFSINAIWEEALGEKLRIPAPRYDQAIHINPMAFRWIPVAGSRSAFRKPLGTFSEREVKAEIFLIEPNGRLALASGTARRLVFVLDGSGEADSADLGRHFGLQVDPGETAAVTANTALTLLSFTLPPVSRDWTEPQLPSFEPVPGEAVSEPV
jgi:hypothetical protein